ncbi:homeobox protein 4-like [Mytilus edulis]|uniref:homeobox protein 4-like n=1 Tax=Mytilus edulis TaxID=6550 RepID=UPI0039EE4C3D
MPRRGSKKSDLTKRKEQRDRMRERRVKQTDDKNLISTVNQSDTSLNCPINNDQSVISQNCPIHNDQSVISQNCPIHNDQSVNSINCPIQQDQSLNSINCPINIDQSINSINCFTSNDQSVNSLNCPFEQDQSVNSINYPTNNFQSVNSINCSTNNDQSVNSINCSTNNDQSVNSINCFTNNDQSVNSLNCPYDTETIKLNPSIKSESNRSIKSESTISIKLNKTTKSIKLNKLMKSKVDPESSTSKLDYESVESIKNNLDNESVRINLDFESVETNYAFESNGTNLDNEVVNRTLDNEKVESNLGYESRKSKQSSKSTYNLKETMVSNLNDTIQLGTNLEKKSSDAKNEHTNSLEFLKNIGSIINEKENIQMDFNDFLEFEQDDNLLKLYSQRNKRTIPENSIEARRSLFDNWVVQGSFHQGDIRFGINSGKQCVANCLSALAHSKFKDLNDWNQIYLDNVLIDGNRIYSRIHGDNIHLLVSDLPDMIDMSGMLLKISRKESITAVVDTSGTINFSEFGNSLPLDQALQESLIDYDACFICAYDTTFLALKHNQDLLLFDSHARNKLGFKDSDGKSLLLKLSNLDHLYQYCCNMMAGASQNQWFEVTGVSICIFWTRT